MNHPSLNPYQPPGEINPPSLNSADGQGTCFRDNQFLVIRDGSILPDRCIITNQAVDSKGSGKPIRVVWSPRWILWMLMLGPLGYAIAIACTQKRAKFTVGMGKELRHNMVISRFIGLVMFVLMGGCIVACVKFWETSQPVAVFAGCAALVFLLMMGRFMRRAIPLKAVMHIDGFFRVKGCSEAFLNSLPAMIPSPFDKVR